MIQSRRQTLGAIKQSGFTLLEILLASTILVVLLGIMGNVTLMLLRSETTRMQQTDRQRVVRQWSQILNDDFRSAIQDTEQLNKAVGEETIRHFGLSGTSTQLRIDISNYTWQSAESSELRTIFYEFQQTGGLIRREQDYAASKTATGTFQTAPEIVSGKFRYFDGSTWHDQWASLDRKGAPAAVEITFYSLPFTDLERWQQQLPDASTPVLTRMVVQLPAASQSYFESYQREQSPKPPEEPKPTPVAPATPSPPSPPSQSPFHSFFGDE